MTKRQTVIKNEKCLNKMAEMNNTKKNDYSSYCGGRIEVDQEKEFKDYKYYEYEKFVEEYTTKMVTNSLFGIFNKDKLKGEKE